MDATNLTKLGFTLIQYLIVQGKSWIKFKSSDVLYCDSNKKEISDNQFKTVINQYNDWEHVFVSSHMPISFRKYKWHFLKQRYCLYKILKNIQSVKTIAYSGMASTPLSVFDGYILGDSHIYKFYDMNNLNSELYSISYHKNQDSSGCSFNIPENAEEVCLVIDTSSPVSMSSIKPFPPNSYGKILPKKLTSKNLQDVYNFVFDFMEACNRVGVKKVHLYANCKQPVAFIVGTAIQPKHPETIAYEWYLGEYRWALSLPKAKLMRDDK